MKIILMYGWKNNYKKLLNNKSQQNFYKKHNNVTKRGPNIGPFNLQIVQDTNE